MAKLHKANRFEVYCQEGRFIDRDGAHRGPEQSRRFSSGSRLRRRPCSNPPALLHEFCFAQVHPERRSREGRVRLPRVDIQKRENVTGRKRGRRGMFGGVAIPKIISCAGPIGFFFVQLFTRTWQAEALAESWIPFGKFISLSMPLPIEENQPPSKTLAVRIFDDIRFLYRQHPSASCFLEELINNWDE